MSKDNTISTLYLKTQNKIGLQYLGVTSKDAYSYKGSGEVWKKKIKEYGRKKSDIDTLVLFTDKMEGKSTSKLFQEVCLWTSKMLGVVDKVNFANNIEENGVLGAYGTSYYKYDWVGQSKFIKWTKENKEQSSDDVLNNKKYFQNMKAENISNDLEKNIDNKKLKVKLNSLLSILNTREERALRIYFEINDNSSSGEISYNEVGRQLGISGGRAGQIIAVALNKLKWQILKGKYKDLQDFTDVSKNERDIKNNKILEIENKKYEEKRQRDLKIYREKRKQLIKEGKRFGLGELLSQAPMATIKELVA